MKEWIDLRISKNTKIIHHENELIKYIEENPHSYCLCTNAKLQN